jgi:hypothetical protein
LHDILFFLCNENLSKSNSSKYEHTSAAQSATACTKLSLSLEELPDFVVARVARDCALLLRICVGEATEITSVTGRTKRREENLKLLHALSLNSLKKKNRLRRRKRKRRRGRRSSITIVIVIYCIRTEYE